MFKLSINNQMLARNIFHKDYNYWLYLIVVSSDKISENSVSNNFFLRLLFTLV